MSALADAFAAFLDTHIDPGPDASLRDRLDLTERLVELVRFERDLPANRLRLTDVAHSHAAIPGSGSVLTVRPGRPSAAPHALRPWVLQAPLLVFLLLGEGKQVAVAHARQHTGTRSSQTSSESVPIRVIEAFRARLRARLTVADIERTASGKQRFYTNTHFAATVLREAGLLRYTRREAFKIWELTPLGTLAALELYDPAPLDRLIHTPEPGHYDAWHGLHPGVVDALHDLDVSARLSRALGRAAYVRDGDGSWLETHAEDAAQALRAARLHGHAFNWRHEKQKLAEQRQHAQGLAHAFQAIEALAALLDDLTLDAAQRARLDAFKTRR